MSDRCEALVKANETEYRRAVRKIKAHYAPLINQAREGQDVEFRTIQEKAEHSRQTIKKKYEEALWLAETVYEATKNQPREQFERVRVAIDGDLQKLQAAERTARELVRRYRQRPASLWKLPLPGGEETEDAASNHASTLQQSALAAQESLQAMRSQWAARLFPGVRLPAFVVLITGSVAALSAWRTDWQWSPGHTAATVGAAGLSILLAAVFYAVARSRLRPQVERLRMAVAAGQRAHDLALQAAEDVRDRKEAELIEQREHETQHATIAYEPMLRQIDERQQRHIERIKQKYPELRERREARCAQQLDEARARYESQQQEIAARRQEKIQRAQTTFDQEVRRFRDQSAARWDELKTRWDAGTQRFRGVLEEIGEANRQLFPNWNDPEWVQWHPPDHFPPAIRFGELEVDLERIEGGVPRSDELSLPFPPRFALPATLTFPDACSALLEYGAEDGAPAIETLQTLMFRLLTLLPPSKVRFTIIDPVGLGQNFAGVHAPGRFDGVAGDGPHLDPAPPHRAAAGRPDRPHGERHPEVPAQ